MIWAWLADLEMALQVTPVVQLNQFLGFLPICV
jgi:hypothetical protein